MIRNPLSNFFQFFKSVEIVSEEPKEFYKENIIVHKQEFRGFWKIGLNAGGPLINAGKISTTFLTNAQYLIKNCSGLDSKCVIALSQATKDVEFDDLLYIGGYFYFSVENLNNKILKKNLSFRSYNLFD